MKGKRIAYIFTGFVGMFLPDFCNPIWYVTCES